MDIIISANVKKLFIGVAASSILFIAAAPSANASSYSIKQGDTFWNIAKTRHVSFSAVTALNSNLDSSNLQVGKTIQLPDGSPGQYIVSDSETFWSIGEKLNMDYTKLVAANPQVDPYNMYAGITLQIPGYNNHNTRVQAANKTASGSNVIITATGEKLAYDRVLNVKATAYSADPAENGGTSLDYFGNPLSLHTIAVDPSIIPLKSSVYITGYTFDGLPVQGMVAKANDTGSAIKKDRIDIFLPGTPQEVSKFGIQDVKVYILK